MGANFTQLFMETVPDALQIQQKHDGSESVTSDDVLASFRSTLQAASCDFKIKAKRTLQSKGLSNAGEPFFFF